MPRPRTEPIHPTGEARPAVARLRTADGESLHAEVRPGPGPDWVVLAHGFSGSTAVPSLRRVADGLARRATVLAYDARGHGRSTGLSTLADREVLDVDAAVAHARAAGARRVATVGFSMGGAAVLRHAAGASEGLREVPDAVVVVSGTGPWSTWRTASRAMRRLHLLVETRPGRLVTRLVLRTRVDPRGWQPPPVSPADCVTDVTAPLLLVHGDADHYLDLAHPRLLAERSGAPLWVEPGFAHAEEGISAGLVDRIGAHLEGVLGCHTGGVTTIRYWAAARAAAGTTADEVPAGSLQAALSEAVARHGSALEKVLSVCSYVVDGDPVGARPHDEVALSAGALVDVLPPFAGG